MVLGPKQEPFSMWGKNTGFLCRPATPNFSSSAVCLLNNKTFSVQKRMHFACAVWSSELCMCGCWCVFVYVKSKQSAQTLMLIIKCQRMLVFLPDSGCGVVWSVLVLWRCKTNQCLKVSYIFKNTFRCFAAWPLCCINNQSHFRFVFFKLKHWTSTNPQSSYWDVGLRSDNCQFYSN